MESEKRFTLFDFPFVAFLFAFLTFFLQGFDSGMKFGCKAGMAFGHLLAQVEFYHSLGGMSQHLQIGLHTLVPGIKSDSFASGLESALHDLKEADKRWRNEDSDFEAWRAEYRRILESIQRIFEGSGLPAPISAPGMR